MQLAIGRPPSDHPLVGGDGGGMMGSGEAAMMRERKDSNKDGLVMADATGWGPGTVRLTDLEEEG